MKLKIVLVIFFIFLLTGGCIVPYMPDIKEDKSLLVVEGMITDQPAVNTIKLSMSMPLGKKIAATPVGGAQVSISDNLGNSYNLTEKKSGTYETNPAKFIGVTGRKYTLRIKTKGALTRYFSYRSVPVEMSPVPPIDRIYYEKVIIKERDEMTGQKDEGCQIYLDTQHKENSCRFYRWDFSETWEFHIPYDVPEPICWVTENSTSINIKSTSALAENRIKGYPINFVSNNTDKLSVKYSILVKQYSLSEDEYIFWEKMQNMFENVGSLYDMIPAEIPGNLYCIEDPGEKVLGYFSVSALTSKRIFIKDHFSGLFQPYRQCGSDTIFGNRQITGLNILVWVINDQSGSSPPFRVITYDRNCVYCTMRGTKVKPDFWEN